MDWTLSAVAQFACWNWRFVLLSARFAFYAYRAVGEEGFYPENAPQAFTNPGGNQSWAFWEGQDFLVDHQDPNIDFAALHL